MDFDMKAKKERLLPSYEDLHKPNSLDDRARYEVSSYNF